MSLPTDIVPDSERHGLIAWLPAALRPYALLARFDRPIGWWLLYWPCAWGVALSGKPSASWWLLLWLLVGAIAMRAAGCVYNDIVDCKLDARVERTRHRPLASGVVSVQAAWAWLALLAAAGFVVWLQLGTNARLLALVTIPIIAAYPFMKRVTWWPQLWLGLVFASGAPIAFAAANHFLFEPQAVLLLWSMLALYGGSIAWVVGYDTIYALQDLEDDALVGVKSSARALGRHARAGVASFYAFALILWGLAFWLVRPTPIALLALLPMAIHLVSQVAMLKPDDPADALTKFRSNRFAGLLMFLACLAVGMA